MTSAEIRQSFLDFFKEKEHTVVPSASLMPTSPNLLFTNAGMNQFIPYFLGTDKAPYSPPRAADAQKCIRAGGKHNDLEDVGYDTYHHTLFEMLGNWSFGDYFKAEAIEWAWELVVERWGFPANRLYATVYAPRKGDPSERDQEACDLWAKRFTQAGLDPTVHIVDGDVKDNFWAMGDTGPCGPCSELHIDLTPAGDTRGSLVNADDPRCIEIWNLVFIQFNRDEDGTYRPLPAQHVDTGMGFERACSILQRTENFTDFSQLASNYDTDVFTPIFDKLTEITGREYKGTVPASRKNLSEQEQIDVAFRVIGDHIRTTSFAIADGILPGNKGRNSTIRAILRRAVRFGRELGIEGGDPFLRKLLPVLIDQLGAVFPELVERQGRIAGVLADEETQFNRTLDRGLKLFDGAVTELSGSTGFPPATIVKLWETHGFPPELTTVLLQERGLNTDWNEFEKLAQQHKDTGKEGLDTQIVSAVDIKTDASSTFTGFDEDESDARILELIEQNDQVIAIVDLSPLYVEKGGQLGDTGTLEIDGEEIAIHKTSSVGDALCLHLASKPGTTEGPARIRVNTSRRRNIESHHTATHLLHWALHEKVDPKATQQGSLVAPDRLRFDFNSRALTPEQITAIEATVNARITEDAPLSWGEVRHSDIKERADIMQFFGDKYGEMVRVVQIGGEANQLNGWSMELCGGTHVRNTGSIGRFVIRKEEAIAAGIRRIEALCGEAAEAYLEERRKALQVEIAEITARLSVANEKLGDKFVPVPVAEGDDLTAHRDALKKAAIEAEKALKKSAGANLAAEADAQIAELIASASGDSPAIIEELPGANPQLLEELLNSLKKQAFPGIAILAVPESDKVHIAIYVARDKIGDHQAGKLMSELTPIIDGGGGGKPERARGAGNDPSKTADLLAKAKELLA